MSTRIKKIGCALGFFLLVAAAWNIRASLKTATLSESIERLQRDDPRSFEGDGSNSTTKVPAAVRFDATELTGTHASKKIEVAVADARNDRRMLGCDEIARLEVVDTVGAGQNKFALEVKLPWGGRAAAKRCRKWKCAREGKLQKEAAMLRRLHEQYGGEAALYFGECDVPYGPVPVENVTEDNREAFNKQLKAYARDFSVGYTSVIELGDPLVGRWSMKDRKCFAESYTGADVDDLRGIARRYANFSNGDRPILMGKIGVYSDNIHPQQYMTGRGDRRGVIQHIDLDMLFSCKENCCTKDNRFDPKKLCTYENVLAVNCKVMSELTNIPNLTCSVDAAAGGGPTANPGDSSRAPSSGKNRINATGALEECEKRGRKNLTEEEFKTRIHWRPGDMPESIHNATANGKKLSVDFGDGGVKRRGK